MTARTDVHRVGAVIPSDYAPLFAYERPQRTGPGFRFDCVRDRGTWKEFAPGVVGMVAEGRHDADLLCCVMGMRSLPSVRWAEQGGPQHCSICGAYFAAGELWQHRPSGEVIHVGHDCADKYALPGMDRAAWERWHANETRLRSVAAKEKRFKTAALRFLEERPELKAAFDTLNVEDAREEKERAARVPLHAAAEAHYGDLGVIDDACPLCRQLPEYDQPAPARAEDPAEQLVYILRDMVRKLNKYGSLSDKQVAFALALPGRIEETRRRAEQRARERAEEKKAPAPRGRVTFEGRVVSAKWHETGFGNSIKMTIKVETPEGVWLAWVTAGSDLREAYFATGQTGDMVGWLRGRRISLTATLTPGNEPHFAFGKRPTGAKVLEEGR